MLFPFLLVYLFPTSGLGYICFLVFFFQYSLTLVDCLFFLCALPLFSLQMLYVFPFCQLLLYMLFTSLADLFVCTADEPHFGGVVACAVGTASRRPEVSTREIVGNERSAGAHADIASILALMGSHTGSQVQVEKKKTGPWPRRPYSSPVHSPLSGLSVLCPDRPTQPLNRYVPHTWTGLTIPPWQADTTRPLHSPHPPSRASRSWRCLIVPPLTNPRHTPAQAPQTLKAAAAAA